LGVSGFTTRINNGDSDIDEDNEFVCIHCVSKVYHSQNNSFICLDAEGIHPHDYLEYIVENWQQVELELGRTCDELSITEYNFSDETNLYWADLEKTNAKIDLRAIEFAKQHISKFLSAHPFYP
jgi:hypothetical protein